jgi:hypothetical protein
MIETVLDRAIDVLFPRACAGCGMGPWPFCGTCTGELVPLEPPWCRRCGRPSHTDVDRCRDCPPAPIESARAAFAYRGPAREAVHRLKFSGWRGVGDALAAAGARTRAGSPRGRLRPQDQGDLPAGSTRAGRATGRDEGCVRMYPTEARAGATPPRRRRAHHGRDGLGLRCGAAGGGSSGDPSRHGVPFVHRSASGASWFAPSVRPAYTRVCSRPGLWLPGDQPR